MCCHYAVGLKNWRASYFNPHFLSFLLPRWFTPPIRAEFSSAAQQLHGNLSIHGGERACRQSLQRRGVVSYDKFVFTASNHNIKRQTNNWICSCRCSNSKLSHILGSAQKKMVINFVTRVLFSCSTVCPVAAHSSQKYSFLCQLPTPAPNFPLLSSKFSPDSSLKSGFSVLNQTYGMLL